MLFIARAAVTVSALVFGLLIPVLEINETHLFNPGWPEHARLHEAWQLITNAGLSGLAVFLVWSGRALRLAIGISLIVGVSFLAAFALAGTYGGSMRHTDGSEMLVGGMNVAVLIVSVLTVFITFSWIQLRGVTHDTNDTWLIEK